MKFPGGENSNFDRRNYKPYNETPHEKEVRMNEKIEVVKTKANSAKSFVKRHQTAFAVGGTAVLCLALNRLALREHDEFLKEKGLHDEFYSQEDE